MTDTLAATRFATPRPVPRVRLTVDGTELNAERTATLASVRVRREVSAPAACELVFEDPVDAAGLEEALGLGTGIRVDMEELEGTLFTGDVLAIERVFSPDGTITMTVRCQDAAHGLRGDSQLRAFVDVSVAELARDLAGAAGLSVSAPGEGPRLPRLVQDGRSSLDVLTTVTRRAGLWWQVAADGDTLDLFDAAGRGDEITVTYGQDLLEASVVSSAVANRSGWRVVGWDPVTGEVATGSASGDGAAPGAGEGVVGGTLTMGGDHLDAMAQGLVDDDAAAARWLRAVVDGDPGLAPGTVVTVEGLTPGASGSYVLLSAEHLVDTITGYTCTVSSEPPAHLRVRDRLEGGSAREGTALTTAEVLRIDDPEGRGRVRVSMPAYDGLESEWLPVVALGAGEAKGLSLQPDIGDAVLVAHDPRDLGRGIVLGGLRSTDGGEPGVGVVDGAVGVYGLRLPGGQSVRLAADGDSVAIVNATGSRIELTETGIVVHAEGDLVLEAPGRLLRLQADRIELEQV